MNLRVLIIGLTIASSGAAEPEDQQAVIERLEAQVEQLRAEVRVAREELRRNEQLLRELSEQVSPRPVAAPVYSSAVRAAIFDLSDSEQQLISGQVEGVEERLVRAHATLEGSSAAKAVEAALDALLRGDLGNARGYLAQAITLSEQTF